MAMYMGDGLLKGAIDREAPSSHSLAPFLRGEGGVKGCLCEFGLNCKQDALDISKNVIVPEANDLITFFSQAFVSNSICRRFIVLTTVDFDNEALFTADEVADVTSNGLLPDELVAIDPPVTNPIPEDCLCVRLIDAEPACESDGLLIVATHCPVPHLDSSTRFSPQGRTAPGSIRIVIEVRSPRTVIVRVGWIVISATVCPAPHPDRTGRCCAWPG